MTEVVRDVLRFGFKAAGWVFGGLTLAIALLPSSTPSSSCGSTIFRSVGNPDCLLVRTGLDLPLILAGLAVLFFLIAHDLSTLKYDRK